MIGTMRISRRGSDKARQKGWIGQAGGIREDRTTRALSLSEVGRC